MAKSWVQQSPQLTWAVNATLLNSVTVGLQLGVPLVQPRTVEFQASTSAMIVKLTGLVAWMVMAFTCCKPKFVVTVAAISNTTRRLALRKARYPSSYQDK